MIQISNITNIPLFLRKYTYLAFLFLSGIFFGLFIARAQGLVDGESSKDTKSETIITQGTVQGTVPGWGELSTSSKIQEAYDIISSQYYHFNEVQKTKLEDGIIQGIISALDDKHSEFFTLDEAKEFHEVLSGDFEGIGAVIGEDTRGVIIEKIIEDSPAQKSGLKAGQIITEVNSESLAGVSTSDAVKKIRGPKGTSVVLKLFSPADSSFETKTVVRDSVVVPSVTEKILTGTTLGYIEMSIFGENTDREFSEALASLTKQGATGLIVDLRYNGGGYLDEAVKIISHFFNKNLPLVTTKETDPRKNQTLFSLQGEYTKIPLIILVNDMSASASEITAGAIQDYGRGILVGQKTYGKGSVQQPFVLSDGSEMKLTIARWYTPKDRGIDKKGIEPDIEVLMQDSDYKEKYDRQLEEAKKILESLIRSGGNVPKTIEIEKQRIHTTNTK